MIGGVRSLRNYRYLRYKQLCVFKFLPEANMYFTWIQEKIYLID